MLVTSVAEGDAVRLSFQGLAAIDSRNAVEVKRQALAHLRAAPNVIVDLTGVEFVDSAGIGALIGLFKHARGRGGRARFCGLTPGVLSVLELIQLDRIFEIYGDADPALRS